MSKLLADYLLNLVLAAFVMWLAYRMGMLLIFTFALVLLGIATAHALVQWWRSNTQ